MARSLDEDLASVQASVRKAPNEARLRGELWQVYAVMGDWGRARTQLDVLARLDPSFALDVQGCKLLIAAEEQRERVLRGLDAPPFVGEPPSWAGMQISGLRMLAAGETKAATEAFTRALEIAESRPGEWNGERFEWICDGDVRMGPCLEVVTKGRYFWIELRLLERLTCEQPKTFTDVIWQPARMQLANSAEFDVYLPARYPFGREEAHLRAARTDWNELGEGMFIGAGQKCMQTDVGSHALLDLRSLVLQ